MLGSNTINCRVLILGNVVREITNLFQLMINDILNYILKVCLFQQNILEICTFFQCNDK